MVQRKKAKSEAQPEAQPETQPPETTETTALPSPQETSLVPKESEFSSIEDLQTSIDKELSEAIMVLSKKFSPKKRGLHADSSEGGGGFRPQIIKIHQPTTGSAPDSSKPGNLITNTNELIGDEYKFIPFSFWRERVKWPEGATISDQPQCKSVDGINGFWERSEWRKCISCPHRQWTHKEDSDKGYFPCKESLNVLTVDEDLSDFYRIQFASSNVSIGKKFYSAIKSHVEVFDSIWSIKTKKSQRYPTHEYCQPSVVRKLTKDEDLYKVADFFMDMVEEAKAKRDLAQQQYMTAGAELAGTVDITDFSGEDSDATPDLNM